MMNTQQHIGFCIYLYIYVLFVTTRLNVRVLYKLILIKRNHFIESNATANDIKCLEVKLNTKSRDESF